MSEHHFLAMDYGAESGRGIIATLEGGKVRMEEIHRFPNRRVTMAGTTYWDFPFLFAEMLTAMNICAQRGVKPASMSVDTWGVDFGLLDERGKLLGLPVSYRDSRTEKIHEYSDPILSRDEIFAQTGYEPWAIASLFQLLAMQRDGSPLLPAAKTFLNMPDLFNFHLTGKAANELSILNTSNLMDVNCQWATEIIERFKLPAMFGNLIAPANVLGELSGAVADATGLGALPVVATCGHDTSAALAAVPAEGEDWAFLSCGTWSILGSLIDKPVATPRCLELGFTNEYTIEGWYVARNILGLWLVQELRRQWDANSDPWDYVRMTNEAGTDEAAKFTGLVDVADDSLMAPADMETALLGVLAKHDQPTPGSRGQLVRCVLESLALEYAERLDSVSELTGRKRGNVFMVGGGIHNKLLCQFTADACGVPVHAGADQCTALGNALAQALAMGVLKTPDDVRKVMRNSTEMTTYKPRDTETWEKKREAYRNLRK